jgi:hypothetical protein
MNMHELDDTLRSISLVAWPGRSRNPRIEEALMLRRDHRLRIGWWTGLGTLALAGVVSAGVLASYRAFTLRILVDDVEHAFNVEPDAEGRAVVQVPLPNGEAVTMLISEADVDEKQTFSAEIYTDPDEVPAADRAPEGAAPATPRSSRPD